MSIIFLVDKLLSKKPGYFQFVTIWDISCNGFIEKKFISDSLKYFRLTSLAWKRLKTKA